VLRRAGVAAVLLLAFAQTAHASDEPVTLTVDGPSVAAVGVPFGLTTEVAADARVLDIRTAPLRIRVRLASECGGTFDTTPGTTLIDAELQPAPTAGKAYDQRFARTLTLPSLGTLTACAFLEEEGDNRMFAFDSSTQIALTKRCTTATKRVASSSKRVASARRALRHAHSRRAKQSDRRRLARAKTQLAHAKAGEKTACPA
jgi:hypothetical protein